MQTEDDIDVVGLCDEQQKLIGEQKAKIRDLGRLLKRKGRTIRDLRLKRTNFKKEKAQEIRDLKKRQKSLEVMLQRVREEKKFLRTRPPTTKQMKAALLADPEFTRTRAEVNHFFGYKKQPTNKWTRDWIIKALLIRCKSKATYEMTRNLKIAPLPGR